MFSRFCSRLPLAAFVDCAAPRRSRLPPGAEHHSAGRGRRQSRPITVPRAVERRDGRDRASSGPRAAPCRAHPDARSARLLQRPEVPPRDPRLHGAGRRSEGHRRRRLRPARPQGRIHAGAVPSRKRRRGAVREAPTARTASSSSCSCRNAGLDGNYTVIGRVVKGMDAVDKIAPGEPPADPTKIVRRICGDALSPASEATAADAGLLRRSAAAMRVDLFDFDLPPERIALRPARPRDSARLLLRAREARSPIR